VLIAIPLALTLSGNWPVVANAIRSWLAVESPLRVAVITVLIGCGMIAFTWKQLVQNLYVGLTGREWVVKSSVFAGLAFLVVLGPTGKWVYDHEQYRAGLRDLLPWLAGFAVCLKASAVVWIVRRLRRRCLVSDRTLVTIGAVWLGLFVGLFGLLQWL